MSLKCEFILSDDNAEPDNFHVCNARATKLVHVTEDLDDISVCEQHYLDMLPDCTLVAHIKQPGGY